MFSTRKTDQIFGSGNRPRENEIPVAKTRGPLIILELSHSATPLAKHAREIPLPFLEEALGNWMGWRITYGSGQTDQAIAFKRKANQQLRRIRAEIERRRAQAQ
jgi:hypothetical protein